jgi:hypothetical protein
MSADDVATSTTSSATQPERALLGQTVLVIGAARASGSRRPGSPAPRAPR